MASKMVQDSARCLKMASKMLQETPRPLQDGPWPRSLPKEAPKRPKSFKHLKKINDFCLPAFSLPMAFRSLKMASRWPKRAPRGAQESPKMARRCPQDGSKMEDESKLKARCLNIAETCFFCMFLHTFIKQVRAKSAEKISTPPPPPWTLPHIAYAVFKKTPARLTLAFCNPPRRLASERVEQSVRVLSNKPQLSPVPGEWIYPLPYPAM